ncbi:MAG: cytochrome b N-terminal domain-containing protein [Deltaproteobacteria bacterium]|nr:cytochrome b N-terminal domain-containing protein [Deltaproteobacteria bacterium]
MGVRSFLEDRTGLGRLVRGAVGEEIPGGARWAYVLGSALVAALAIQVLTGLGLMLTYSPGATTAWGSVYFIENRVALGWLLRGMHHHGAQAMVVVLGFHLLQVSLTGAYKRPREVNWWSGLCLLLLTQAFALTGYLLPWDQKGFWATQVATSILAVVAGDAARDLVVGGAELGTATVTRFYALHVAFLPAALVGLFALHLYLFRRHGVTPPPRADLSLRARFHPDQLLKDLAAGLAVLLIVAWLAVLSHGAPLDAPADPASEYPARPEWYFLWLFVLLEHIGGRSQTLGLTIPAAVILYLFALPLLDRGEDRGIRARAPWVGSVVAIALGVVALTVWGLVADARDEALQAARAVADQRARRAMALASSGIPPEGASELLRRDPETRGPELFAEHCSECHRLGGRGGEKASELHFFGSRRWILALVKDPAHPDFFGHTKHRGMEPQTELGESALYAVATFLESQGADGREVRDMTRIPAGERIFRESCMDCHLFGHEGRATGAADGPDLRGYGSEDWIRGQLVAPDDPARYGESHEMPSFAEQLGPEEIEILVQFVRRERRAGVSLHR